MIQRIKNFLIIALGGVPFATYTAKMREQAGASERMVAIHERVIADMTKKRAQTEEWQRIYDSIMEPYKWLPEEGLTPIEGKSWEQVLTSPLGRKIDVALHNWAAQRALEALNAPNLERAAGMAQGARLGWEIAKSLSRIAVAQDGTTDDADTTEAEVES